MEISAVASGTSVMPLDFSKAMRNTQVVSTGNTIIDLVNRDKLSPMIGSNNNDDNHPTVMAHQNGKGPLSNVSTHSAFRVVTPKTKQENSKYFYQFYLL